MSERQVRIPIDGVTLDGDLTVPAMARGVVFFANGSGSSRFSPRNRHVAGVLQESGLGTLLLDLVTPDEEQIDASTDHLRFDIGMLAERLVQVTVWVGQQSELRGLAVGYFGASTGGGAALVAAAQRPDAVSAVVSRGGRPDLAGPALPRVTAPTLRIVGGLDLPVIDMNAAAQRQMRAETKPEIVPGASHLFEEPGTLDQAALLARDWFLRCLASAHETGRGSAA